MPPKASPATARGSKRKSGPTENHAESSQPKKQKGASEDVVDMIDLTKDSPPPPDNVVEKPRLTTPDIEFDYDRSQLRDPRPTPGRKARPHYNERDIPPEVMNRIRATRTIPGPPPKPKGRLTREIKDEMFRAEARANPLKTFHELYKCKDKGPKGSPTYDEGGFELDYDKVMNWFQPQRYNKSRIVGGMMNHLKRVEIEEKQMFGLFFTNWQGEKGDADKVKDYLKDHVSKDLGVPWHKIESQHVQTWRDKGFQPVVFEEWWKEPTEEERKRFMKMLGGGSLRKDV